MQPENRKDRSKRGAESRARRFLQDGLGWIRGFPIDRDGAERIRWMTYPAPVPEKELLKRIAGLERELGESPVQS